MQGHDWYQVRDEHAKRFTASEWDNARASCTAEMRDYAERSGIPFPNAFDGCMKSKAFFDVTQYYPMFTIDQDNSA
jgi:hypothetical protein